MGKSVYKFNVHAGKDWVPSKSQLPWGGSNFGPLDCESYGVTTEKRRALGLKEELKYHFDCRHAQNETVVLFRHFC